MILTPQLQEKGLSLYPFQREGVEFLLASDSKHLYLGDDPGLGKTCQSLVFANCIAATKVLILVPAVGRLTWYREACKWYTMKPQNKPFVLLRGKDLRLVSVKGAMDRHHSIPSPFICSYDMLVRMPALFQWAMSRDWDLIIYDEAHALKNLSAKRTDLCINYLPQRARRVLFMSGTPLTRAADDFFPPLWLISQHLPEHRITPQDKFLCSNYDAFAMNFCYHRVTKYATVYEGFKNHAQMRDLLARGNFWIRRLKDEVLEDMPEKTYSRIDLSIKLENSLDTEATKRALANIEEDKDPDKDTENSIARFRRELGEAKANSKEFYAFLEERFLEPGIPVVIFAWHKNVISSVVEKLSLNQSVGVIVGETSPTKRQEAVDDFQAGRTKVLVGNVISAGVNITLTAAHNVVFLEWDFLPSSNEQAIDRVRRIGQKNAVEAFYISSDHPLDKKLIRNMIYRQKQIAKIYEV